MKAGTTALPPGWNWKRMGEVADVVGGGTPRTTDAANYESGEVPWLTPADLSDYQAKHISHGARFITRAGLDSSSARLIPAGTVLFTSRAPIGYVAIAQNEMCTNQGFKSFVLKGEVLPDYAYWWLKGSKELAESMASGTTFLELSGRKAKELPIPVAPLEQQPNIVAEIEKLFSRLDEAVARLQRVKANLERYKAAVLEAAVEGRLTEAWREAHPDIEPASELLERILAERRAKWEEAELAKMKAKAKPPSNERWKGRYKRPPSPDITVRGMIPATWTWATYAQIADITTGFTPPTTDPRNFGGNLPFVKPTDLEPGERVVDAREHLSDVGAQKGRTLPAGSVLVTCIGATIGKTGLARVACATNQQINSASVFSTELSPDYLYKWTISPEAQQQILENASATTLPILNKSKFEQLLVPLPPAAEQAIINSEVDRRFSVIRAVEVQTNVNIGRAQRLRQAILAAAFSGRLLDADQPREELSKGLAQLDMVADRTAEYRDTP